jgi:hypothetical protein
MVAITFQNPSKGPLITIQLELEETLLGFVATAERIVPRAGAEALRDIANGSRLPGGVPSGSAPMLGRAFAIAGKLSPYLIALGCAGDSRPRVIAQADASPALAPIAAPVVAVSLSDDVTTTLADATWEALATSGDLQNFIHTIIAVLRRIQRELADKIDQGEFPPTILKWYLDTVVPQLNRILKLTSGDRDSAALIDRLWLLISAIPMYLQAQQLDTARELALQSPRSLSAIIDEIVSRYADRIMVTQIGTLGVRLAESIDLEKFKSLLEEIIRNAAAHPRRAGDMVRMTIDLTVGSIVIRSDDRQNEYAAGWDVVWEKGDALHVLVENEKLGKESLATLVLPDGLMEPDPLQFVLGRQGDQLVAQILIDAMTPEQRVAMLREMDKLMDRIEDQALSQGLDMLSAADGAMPYAQNLAGVAMRMEMLMRMLVQDLPNVVKLARIVDYTVEQMWLMVKDPMGRYMVSADSLNKPLRRR